MTDSATNTIARNGWNIALWIAQGLLALFYGFAGFNKVSQPMEALAAMGMGFTLDFPELVVRFIGTMEILGSLGIILPALTRIMPRLTPLAALGLSTIQVLAIGVHAMRGETGQTLPINLAALALSLFVLWGRTSKAPVAPR